MRFKNYDNNIYIPPSFKCFYSIYTLQTSACTPLPCRTITILIFCEQVLTHLYNTYILRTAIYWLENHNILQQNHIPNFKLNIRNIANYKYSNGPHGTQPETRGIRIHRVLAHLYNTYILRTAIYWLENTNTKIRNNTIRK